MPRGYFADFASNPAYAETIKDWHITIRQSSCYWYELIVNPPDFIDTKSYISLQLKNLMAEVEQTLETRFIYFFASRTKIRFDTTRPPKYSFWKKWLTITLLIGRDKKRCIVKIKTAKNEFDGSDGCPLTPRVEVSERFIHIIQSDTTSQTLSVHDFLHTFGIEIGITTQVHYVGITKDPVKRLLSRKHRGIADTLYNVSNEENDFFYFVNLFRVISNAKNNAYRLRFAIPNSMSNEIPIDKEGRVIESALIAYFNCASQNLNREKERTILSNQFASLAKEHKIQSVSVHLEIEPSNEYFVFGSAATPPALNHSFRYHYANRKVEMECFASEDELLSQPN
ncbi:hypothetical protein AGMMS50229_10280 [Campylobacterota bacterium]|nr:hypothetical protein AGMMS50229_10280 [Campylobacterota bacterium]